MCASKLYNAVMFADSNIDAVSIVQLVGERLDPSRMFGFPFPLQPPSSLTPDIIDKLLVWSRAQHPPTEYHTNILLEFAIFLQEYLKEILEF